MVWNSLLLPGELAAFSPVGSFWIGFVRLALTYGFNFEQKSQPLFELSKNWLYAKLFSTVEKGTHLSAGRKILVSSESCTLSPASIAW